MEQQRQKKLLSILLAASKKPIMRKWLKVEPPTMNDWIDTVYDIYVMEKISYSLKAEKEKFFRNGVLPSFVLFILFLLK